MFVLYLIGIVVAWLFRESRIETSCKVPDKFDFRRFRAVLSGHENLPRFGHTGGSFPGRSGPGLGAVRRSGDPAREQHYSWRLRIVVRARWRNPAQGQGRRKGAHVNFDRSEGFTDIRTSTGRSRSAPQTRSKSSAAWARGVSTPTADLSPGRRPADGLHGERRLADRASATSRSARSSTCKSQATNNGAAFAVRGAIKLPDRELRRRPRHR